MNITRLISSGLAISLALSLPMSPMGAKAAPTPAKDSSLLIYYSFDKDDGDVVKDLSGNNRDAEVKGGQWEAKGKTGGGWRTGGDLNQPLVVDCSSFPELNAYTTECWVNLDKQPDDFGRIFEESQHCGFVVNPSNQNGTLMSYVTFDGTERGEMTITEEALSVHQWHHVASVWDGKTNQIWIDGIQEKEQERMGKMNLPWGNAYVGWLLPGVIDEFKFYSRALGAKEIKEHFMGSKSSVNFPVTPAAQGKPAAKAVPAVPDHATMIKNFKAPDGVEMHRDLEYGKGNGVALLMDTFRPVDRKGPLPAIVFIHGGGWNAGQKEDYWWEASAFAKLGYFTATVEYRFLRVAKFPAQIEDCKCAVRFLRAKANEFGIDPAHIGAMGHSAGAHLSALLGTSADVKALEGNGGWQDFSSRIQAACTLAAPTDFVGMIDEKEGIKIDWGASKGGLSDLFGVPVRENLELIKTGSPITYVSKDSAAFLIVHGDKDDLVPYQQGVDFYQALKKAGADVIWMPLIGQGHGVNGPALEKARHDFFNRVLKGIKPEVQ